MPPLPDFNPPLLNSASLWASTYEDLNELYRSHHTGAVTTRTIHGVTHGFGHDEAVHQHEFFDSTSLEILPKPKAANEQTTLPCFQSNDLGEKSEKGISTMNTLGYSPYRISQYIEWVGGSRGIEALNPSIHKPVIFSFAGNALELATAYQILASSTPQDCGKPRQWCMEINLSCPNIAGKPPPAYSKHELRQLLVELVERILKVCVASWTRGEGDGPALQVPIGLKLPPYTYSGQFDDVVDVLIEVNNINPSRAVLDLVDGIDHSAKQRVVAAADKTFTSPFPIAFLTSTNTLGSSLLMSGHSADDKAYQENPYQPALNSADGSGIGGMAGAALHPLALGNIRILKQRLSAHPETREIKIIGVGGVSDNAGFMRMRAVGADAVACATALGAQGMGVFQTILGKS